MCFVSMYLIFVGSRQILIKNRNVFLAYERENEVFGPCKICQKYAYEFEAIDSPNGFNDIETEKLQIKGDDGCVGNVKDDNVVFGIHTHALQFVVDHGFDVDRDSHTHV